MRTGAPSIRQLNLVGGNQDNPSQTAHLTQMGTSRTRKISSCPQCTLPQQARRALLKLHSLLWVQAQSIGAREVAGFVSAWQITQSRRQHSGLESHNFMSHPTLPLPLRDWPFGLHHCFFFSFLVLFILGICQNGRQLKRSWVKTLFLFDKRWCASQILHVAGYPLRMGCVISFSILAKMAIALFHSSVEWIIYLSHTTSVSRTEQGSGQA